MADFMTDLWNAIFEAGPTPTLLIATNATFAALQALLFALLIATYSVHFIILSTLCAGLWISINWFAAELRQAQQEKATSAHVGEDEAASSSAAGESSPQVRSTQKDSASKDAHMANVATPQPAFERATTITTALESDSNASQRKKQHETPHGVETSFDSDWEQIDG